MRARLDGEGAERIRRVDLEGRGFDARFFGVAGVEHRRRVPVLLSPPQVHPQQHLREVGSIDASGTGPDGHHSCARIVLAAQEGLHFELAERLLQGHEFGARFVRRLFVAFPVGCEFDQDLQVVESLFDARDARELGLAVAERAGDLLGVLGVVPQVGCARFRVEAGDLLGELVDVDDGSDVAEGGAQLGDLLREIKFNHGVSSLPFRARTPARERMRVVVVV